MKLLTLLKRRRVQNKYAEEDIQNEDNLIHLRDIIKRTRSLDDRIKPNSNILHIKNSVLHQN